MDGRKLNLYVRQERSSQELEGQKLKIGEVIERIEKKHGILPIAEKTCDGMIYGDAQRPCTGIVLTCSPSVPVIQKAADMGYNLIWCHEPTFYHGYDEIPPELSFSTAEEKKRLLDQYRITVYRDHDQVHREKPDRIYQGIVDTMGWEPLEENQKFFPVSGYRVPETTLGRLAVQICRKLCIDGARIIGDAQMKVRTIGLAAHFFGEDLECLTQIDRNRYDVIVPLETVDWTVVSYVMDAVALGKPVGMINVGHFNLEEAGMRAMQGWLKETVGQTIPVQFIPSGNMFGWVNAV